MRLTLKPVFQIIDRYIIKAFLLYFLAGLIVFITVFMAVDALSMTMRFPTAEMSSILNYYIYSLPDLIQQMLPVACLVGTLFTLSALNKSSELVALFASGLSLLRISLPIIATVFTLSASAFLLADQINPRFSQKKNYTYYVEIKKKPSQFSTIRTDRIWYRSKNTILNLKTINGQQKLAQGLTLYSFNDDWDLMQMLTAKKVELRGRQWMLKEGSITLFSEESSFPLTSDFKNKTIVMDEDMGDIQTTANSTDMLSIADLRRYIDRNKEAGLDTLSFEVGYYQKFAQAFSALIMALLGIPFAISRNRSGGTMVNVGICLALVFGYWTLMNSGITLGYHGSLPPLIAAWGANLLMGGVAMVLLQRTKA